MNDIRPRAELLGMRNFLAGCKRRWWQLSAATLLLFLAVVPWILESTPGQNWLLTRVNHEFAPCRVEIGGLRLSWFRSTALYDIVLYDAEGEQLLTIAEAIWDKNLLEILWNRSGPSTVKVTHATVEIHRRGQGWRSLQAILSQRTPSAAPLDLQVEVVEGHLYFTDPALAEAISGKWTATAHVQKSDDLSVDCHLQLHDLSEIAGIQLGAVPIATHYHAGQITIDPIATTLNGGSLRLFPEVRHDENGHPILALGPGSKLQNAQVNQALARNVLAYVAFFLRDALDVRGQLSADVLRCLLPLDPEKGDLLLDTDVTFDLTFRPGPYLKPLSNAIRGGSKQVVGKLMTVKGPFSGLSVEPLRGLAALLDQDDLDVMKLDKTVHVHVADGRVSHRGLTTSLGKFTQLEIEGSTGVDQSLDVLARLSVNPDLVDTSLAMPFLLRPLKPRLKALASQLQIEIPITGTLNRLTLPSSKDIHDHWDAKSRDMSKAP
jgi:hypothetical protein